MKKIIYIFAMSFLVLSCDANKNIGYLVTEDASYLDNEMQIRIELDSADVTYTDFFIKAWERDGLGNPAYNDIHHYFATIGNSDPRHILTPGGIDFIRYRYKLPWETLPIEGIRGTKPIRMYIHSATTSDGNEQSMMKYLTVRGDGTIILPLGHDVKAGKYSISLRVENEGHTKVISDCYYFEVVEKVQDGVE